MRKARLDFNVPVTKILEKEEDNLQRKGGQKNVFKRKRQRGLSFEGGRGVVHRNPKGPKSRKGKESQKEIFGIEKGTRLSLGGKLSERGTMVQKHR